MNHDFDVVPHIGAQVGCSSLDRVIGALAERQHGVVSRRELIATGAGRRAIQHRLDAGRLRPLYRGVYAVGHRVLTSEGRWMAAILASGAGAVLSHRTAAALWGLRRTSLLEITTPIARRRRPGIRLHAAALAGDEVTTHRGIPVTTVARTIFDLAASQPPQRIEALVAEADYRRLTSPTSLGALLSRYPRRRGTRTVRIALGRAPQRTRTEMEADFLAFLDAHALPRPLMNVARTLRGRWIEADAVYPQAKLIVELDGGSHRTERRFHGDRERDRAHLAEGWRTIRVTQRHLGEGLATDLRTLLPNDDGPPRRGRPAEAAWVPEAAR